MEEAVVLKDILSDENRAKQYLEQIRGDLLNLLKDAPMYGSCGFEITLHGGKITKVNKQSEVTIIKEKNNDKI